MVMKRRHGLAKVLGALGVVATLMAGQPASAADPYPARTVRIIVNTAPGGLTDVTARLVAQRMGEIFGQQVIVENRAGGDGLIGIRAVKAAEPDGYTLLVSAGTIVNQMVLRADAGYDVLKDFSSIGLLGRAPFMLVVAPSQPYRNVQELVAAAKADPTKISFASAGVGTVTHLANEAFHQQAGLSSLKLMHVPYKGNGAAMPDVMSGRVTAIFEGYGSGSGKIKSGQLRALGVSHDKRLPSLPDVPTITEQGVPFNYYVWIGLFAPAATPKAVVDRVAEVLQKATSSQALVDRYRSDGMDAVPLSAEETQKFMARELAQITKLTSELGLAKQ